MHVILVFTYGISLKNWDEAGILDREVAIYKKMNEENNIHFSFVTFGDKEDENYSDLIDNLKIVPIYKYIEKSNNKLLNFIRTIIGTKTILKQINNPTFIKTNQLNGSWVAMVMKYHLKLPLYIRTGYNLFEFSIRDKKSVLKKSFYYFLTQWALLYSDYYSVTSSSDKIFLSKYFLTEKILVIPNWVKDIKKNSFENRFKDKILSIGRLEVQKNFDSLIESLSNSDIEIDIIGEGSQKESLKSLAKSNNVMLNLSGNKEHNELNELYLNYKIFVLPSTFEGNPKVVLEAMSRGALVIARSNKNIIEIVKDNQNGIIYKSNAELLDKLIYFLNNKEDWKRITTNAYKTIEEKNIIDIVIKKELDLYG
jgi:glycosyltransferase involved in cell wall biosynthesis